MSRFLSVLFFLMVSIALETHAQSIQWNQPEVVPEKLARENRRVLRLSGTARAGTQLRIRDNKVKMIFSAQKIKWARIPQKHRVQFPVIANDTGYFSFKLYLPTVPVEIPLELFKGGKWVPYRFSFEVPKSGSADEFKFVEESFKVRKEEENMKIEDFLAEYDSEMDQGQVVNDRGEWKSWVTGKVIVWGSLGFTYSSLEQTGTPDELGTFGGMSFPFWEIGGEYRWNPQWKADFAYMNRPGDAEPDGNYRMQNTDLSWTELRANLTYFPFSWESEKYRLGFKGGIQRHEIPFVKRVGGPATYSVFSNDVMYAAVGANFETMRPKAWNFDVSALFLYPVTVGPEFDMESSYGLNMSFAIFKELIPALMLGGKIDMHYLTFEAQHTEIPVPSQTTTADTTLWQMTPSFLIRAEF
jgi:hypothetical protein